MLNSSKYISGYLGVNHDSVSKVMHHQLFYLCKSAKNSQLMISFGAEIVAQVDLCTLRYNPHLDDGSIMIF